MAKRKRKPDRAERVARKLVGGETGFLSIAGWFLSTEAGKEYVIRTFAAALRKAGVHGR